MGFTWLSSVDPEPLATKDIFAVVDEETVKVNSSEDESISNSIKLTAEGPCIVVGRV